MRVCGRGGVGFHTMFLLALVSVVLHLAVLFMCVRVCVVPPFGALLCILNILARHTVVCQWFVGFACSHFHCFPIVRGRPIPFALLLIFFRRVSRGGRSLWRNKYGDIWLWFVFAGMLFDVRGGSSFFFACGVVPWAPSFATYLVFLIYACVAVDMICRTHGAVTYLAVIPCFPVVRGRVFFVCGLVFLLLLCFLLSFFFFFSDAHKPPSSYGTHVARWFGARNVLFFVVATRLFLVFAYFFFFVVGARTSP